MSFVDEITFTTRCARLMGVAPYKISEKNLELSPIAVLYSISVHLFYIYLIYEHALKASHTTGSHKTLTTMLLVRVAPVILSLLVRFVSSFLQYRRICNFINKINKFDDRANLCPITRKREIFVRATLIVPVALICVFQCYSNYAQINKGRGWQWNFFVLYIGVGTITCQYSNMVTCLLRRFKHLNYNNYRGYQPTFTIEDRVNPAERTKFHSRHGKLRDVWILFSDLIDASEELNSMFTFETSLWISALAFNIITRIFGIWDIGVDVETWEVTTNLLSTLACSMLLTNLIVSCHLTANEANSVGSTVFCANSNMIKMHHDWNTENIFSIGQYFVLRRFHFTSASGLLRIDLPLLRTIVGVITTYLVILKSPNGNKMSTKE